MVEVNVAVAIIKCLMHIWACNQDQPKEMERLVEVIKFDATYKSVAPATLPKIPKISGPVLDSTSIVTFLPSPKM